MYIYGYEIFISLPEGDEKSLEFWYSNAPNCDYDSEWEEYYSYDDKEIQAHYIIN